MVRGSESLASKGSYHGLMRTMKLKNKVRPIGKLSERKHSHSVGEYYYICTLTFTAATCVPEMSAMMACWRKNNFEDVPCRKEIEMFLTCSKKVVCHV